LFLLSLPLASIPPVALWPSHLELEWIKATETWANAVDSIPGVAVPQESILAWMLLPIKILGKFAVQKSLARGDQSPRNEADQRDPQQRKRDAVSKAWAFRKFAKAMRILDSHGVAETNSETIEAIETLHPRSTHRKNDDVICRLFPEVKPSEEGQDECLSPEALRFMRIALEKQIKKHDKSLDPLGWAAWLLEPCQAHGSKVLKSVARVFCTIADARIGDQLATLANLGKMLALIKWKDGVGFAGFRPVNIGTLALGMGFQLLTTGPALSAEKKKMEPIQLGVGASRGVERVHHWAAQKFTSGCPILPIDASNGFNATSREKILQASSRIDTLFNRAMTKYYGLSSIAFLGQEAETIVSEEGSRQGCVAGGLGFCAAVHPAYEETLRKNDIHARAIIDDFITTTTEPPGSESLPWTNALQNLATALGYYTDKIETDLHLKVNATKLELLLPPNAPPPTQYTFPGGLSVTTNGLKIGGAPIGSQAFIDSFLAKKLDSFQGLLNQIAGFGDQPYVGLGLLQNSLAKPKYVLGLLPPRQTRNFAEDVDAAVWNALLELLTASDRNAQVPISNERTARAKHIASLPEKMNGLGLRCKS
jgi:hypothetical protein